MKKSVLAVTSLLAISALVACNKGSGGGSCVPQKAKEIQGFNKDYYPLEKDNQVNSITGGNHMTITVALNYEGSLAAWKALGTEYERLCGGAVTVDVKETGDTQSYQTNLTNEEKYFTTSEWDIVSGNLLANSSKSAANLSSFSSSTNPYAGNKINNTFLKRQAYYSDTGTTYMLNTEDLSTSWFVNTDATTQAGLTEEQAKPTTWDELISVLEALQKAGYKYPLGLSLTNDSITGSQFAWLLRVYGDYYFRSYYKYTSATFIDEITGDSTFTYDPTISNIEASPTWARSINRMLCTMMDEGCDYFCGPTSDIYTEFVEQFYKLKKYINPAASGYSFENVRSHFIAQNIGGVASEAPQIVLDYSGKGLIYQSSPALKNHVKNFNYPKMVSDYIPENTVLRYVGGSGGYLSAFKKTSQQRNDLNKDFLKFVLSPYGQTIYYQALEQYSIAPQGITTVNEDLVVMPESWREFFAAQPSIEGKADNNKYLTYGILGMEKTNYDPNYKQTKNGPLIWKKLLTGYGVTSGTYTVDNYNTDWLEILVAAYGDIRSSHSGWGENSYKNENWNTPTLLGTMK